MACRYVHGWGGVEGREAGEAGAWRDRKGHKAMHMRLDSGHALVDNDAAPLVPWY